MSHWSYYNEIDPYCVAWLHNLIAARLIPDGVVDSRSISEVDPADVQPFTQAHFFCGIAGWPLALKLADWPSSRPIWTGSCPCQPFSVAGKGKGTDDERHLWPDFYYLISSCRPPVIMGEQVAQKAGYGWLDGVRSCLEADAYSTGAVDIPSCAVNAPCRRNRIYWITEVALVGGSDSERRDWQYTLLREEEFRRDTKKISETTRASTVGRAVRLFSTRLERHAGDERDGGEPGRKRAEQGGSATTSSTVDNFWSPFSIVHCLDNKARRIEPGTFPLAHGVPARVGKLRAYGNAINPQQAAEVIKSYMDVRP